MEKITYAYAESENLIAIEQLLMECELPHQDVVNHLPHFVVAKQDEKLIGVIGLEVMNTMGLIRSLAVSPAFRGKGIATELCSRILAYAHLKGINELYLLTLTAEGFFSKSGFKKVDRKNVPKAIQSTEEFRRLCPATAVCMVKNIENEPHYYPGEILLREKYKK